VPGGTAPARDSREQKVEKATTGEKKPVHGIVTRHGATMRAMPSAKHFIADQAEAPNVRNLSNPGLWTAVMWRFAKLGQCCSPNTPR
jgi:hypothetical protein